MSMCDDYGSFRSDASCDALCEVEDLTTWMCCFVFKLCGGYYWNVCATLDVLLYNNLDTSSERSDQWMLVC